MMLVLYCGGQLIARLPLVDKTKPIKWVKFYGLKFDDIVGRFPKTYVVDREGKLFWIDDYVKSSRLCFNRMAVSKPVTPDSGLVGWRKRLCYDWGPIYLVVRVEEKVFRVYLLDGGCNWKKMKGFSSDTVLFVSRECYFFKSTSAWAWKGDNEYIKYKNCIVFTEGAFPKYGSDGGWEYSGEDDVIWVFRLSDGCFGRVGESDEFPEIDWSPPSWIFDVREQEGSDSDSHVQEERSDSDIQDQKETEDVEMHSNADTEEDMSLQEDVPPSLFASASAVEEEVTRTLLRLNGVNQATEKESSAINITLSAPRACTSSSTTKGDKSDSSTIKFEGFDIRSDLVPTLQKIWRNHGNIVENSTIRNSDIIAKALESLATMVQILENNLVQSLSDFQVDYLSTTLSDLKTVCFKVHWLVSFVEKAVKIHKSKPLVDSLSKLSQLSTQVKDRKAILLDELAKLTEEESKLKKEMAKVSKLIPFSGQIKFDEPLGSGLT